MDVVHASSPPNFPTALLQGFRAWTLCTQTLHRYHTPIYSIDVVHQIPAGFIVRISSMNTLQISALHAHLMPKSHQEAPNLRIAGAIFALVLATTSPSC
jgi:hypothetical protein